jgi:hypothetical protein
VRIPFGEWLPDQPALDNPGATIAKNVVPRANGYGQVLALSEHTGPLNVTSNLRGIFQAFSVGGGPTTFAGTATSLEELQSDQTWDDVSKSAGYGAAVWDFCQLGDVVIATGGGSNDVQFFDLSSSSVFADLSGSPPRANVCANVRNFIVLGRLSSGAASLQWSGYNNETLWTPSRATQSDERTLDLEHGEIQRIVPGQSGVIFQESAIWTMQYVGPPVIFNLNKVNLGNGTIAGASVCWHGGKIFYLASDGFYQFGSPPIPIGSEKVNRWFFEEAYEPFLSGVRGAIDQENQLVCWSFASAQGLHDRIIFFHWPTGRWSYAEISTRLLTSAKFTGNLVSTSDRSKLMAFNAAEQLGTFSGSALVATVETKELGMDKRVAVNVRPLVDDAVTSVTVADGTRNDDGDTYSFTSAKAPNARGVVNFRTPARYHRIRTTITGGFTSASGVDVEPIEAGLR